MGYIRFGEGLERLERLKIDVRLPYAPNDRFDALRLERGVRCQ
jgi:hypothetical protein